MSKSWNYPWTLAVFQHMCLKERDEGSGGGSHGRNSTVQWRPTRAEAKEKACLECPKTMKRQLWLGKKKQEWIASDTAADNWQVLELVSARHQSFPWGTLEVLGVLQEGNSWPHLQFVIYFSLFCFLVVVEVKFRNSYKLGNCSTPELRRLSLTF